MDKSPAWIEQVPVAVTVTDAEGKIIAMNARSRETFAADGGGALVGQSVFSCHPEPAATKTRALFDRRQPNHYTISRNGQKKVVHQLPWFEEDRFAGFVEFSIPIPDQLPHFNRD